MGIRKYAGSLSLTTFFAPFKRVVDLSLIAHQTLGNNNAHFF